MGTSAGTIVCAGVAGAIATTAKWAGDLAARYGGEEFAVVLAKTSAEGANVVAREICDGIASLKLAHARSSFDISHYRSPISNYQFLIYFPFF